MRLPLLNRRLDKLLLLNCLFLCCLPLNQLPLLRNSFTSSSSSNQAKPKHRFLLYFVVRRELSRSIVTNTRRNQRFVFQRLQIHSFLLHAILVELMSSVVAIMLLSIVVVVVVGHCSWCPSQSMSIRFPLSFIEHPFDLHPFVWFRLSGPFRPLTFVRHCSSLSTCRILQIICTMYKRIQYCILQTICTYFSRSYIGF
jgi:hypothetical protein